MKKNLAQPALIVAALVALVFGANYAQIRMIDYVVAENARRDALNWANFLAAADVPVAGLMNSGEITPELDAKLQSANTLGDVFRFKLFDSQGRLVLLSDSIADVLEPSARTDHDQNAAQVLQSGTALVEMSDGTGKQNRPPLYAEAYVPLTSPKGDVIGVAEVYVDKTEESAIFYDAANKLAIGLSAMFSVALTLLVAAWQVKRRQESRSRRQVDYLAKYDQLTELHNRAGFRERLEAMERAGQMRPQSTAVIFLDLDHFKLINDTHGHRVGDALLRRCGEVLTACLDEKDIAGRFGGDEFVVVLHRNDIQDVIDLTEKIQSLMSTPIRIDGTAISAQMSVGISYGGSSEQTWEDRLNRADLALYQAKLDGRNTYRVFTDELERRVARRQQIELAVAQGVDQGHFSVVFQPLLQRTDNKCAGFEALLRLTDDTGEQITPSEFIPIAESMGSIRALGAWVLERAIEAAKDWPEHLFVSVNLSARQFDDDQLVQTVRDALDKYGFDPKRLELEVTESMLIQNTESVGRQLTELRAMGVSIAMDDFGTGYSSLGYLWQFGFDKLKVDRSFVIGLEAGDSKARDILDTIIVLGHRLDMTVVAEGIETEQQAKILSELSCDQMQGFLYGRPMPLEDLPAFVLRNLSGDNTDTDAVSLPRERLRV